MWEALFAFHICIAWLQPELLRRPVVERAVRTLAVVLAPPACQGASYVIQRSEPACVEALVAQPSVEALDMPVLHRLAGLDMHQPDLPVLGPAQHAPRSELRAVAPHESTGRNDQEGRESGRGREATEIRLSGPWLAVVS